MKSILEADSIEKSYNQTTILSDVYLKCETGDIIGVLGRNGCGKSTLIKIIYGIIPAEHKFVRIDNKIRRKAYKYPSEISYLPQDNFIPRHFKVLKAVQLFLSKETVLEFIDDSFLKPLLNHKIRELSDGELRYLEIKLTLFSDSKFALLDEPYNGLSPLLINLTNQLIIERAKHKGIILTDHNYNNVLKVSTQLYLIKDCSTKKIKNKKELIQFGYLNEGML
ncbi:ATP-binding cassette domain-containing protein [Aureibaculum luteum]|uniref:ATP-binding cassette domain-containing protein n=1 Tax=Aureibaculum luteum TaxID=1548456 RepID=UPI000E4AABB3|nr:ATP-binding cassette domain-containing protein [Aureibaculum luteum]